MVAKKIAAVSAAAVLMAIAGQAVISLASASGQSAPGEIAPDNAVAQKIVAGIVVESVSDAQSGYALGATRDVRVAGFVREALAAVPPAPRLSPRAEPAPVEEAAVASIAEIDEQVESTFSAGAPTNEFAQIVPLPTPRPQGQATRTGKVQAQAPQRPSVMRDRREAKVVAVSDEPRRKRSLTLPLPRMLGVYH